MEGVGLLLAIDPILDMMRTATNVAGQALVPVIVAAREGLLDRKAYDEAHSSPLDEPEPEKQDAKPVPVAA
jgi:Na+/H+-dicarboxylate symporter